MALTDKQLFGRRFLIFGIIILLGTWYFEKKLAFGSRLENILIIIGVLLFLLGLVLYKK